MQASKLAGVHAGRYGPEAIAAHAAHVGLELPRGDALRRIVLPQPTAMSGLRAPPAHVSPPYPDGGGHAAAANVRKVSSHDAIVQAVEQTRQANGNEPMEVVRVTSLHEFPKGTDVMLAGLGRYGPMKKSSTATK